MRNCQTSRCQSHFAVPEKASTIIFSIGGGMKRTTIAIILVSVAVFAVGVIILISKPTIPQKYSGPPAKVILGTSPFDSSGLIWIAEDEGYFARNGLNVTIKDFAAGRYAVNALLDGEVDVATAAEFVLAGNAMKEAKLQTIGCIAKQEFHYFIGRKDRGIEKGSDLKGKRIGLTRQTSSEFYLGRYLQLQGIGLDEVTVIDIKPTQVEESVIKGAVDAILIWDPYAYSIEKRLGSNAVSWPAQSGQMMYWLLIAKRDYITGHPELIDRLLSSFNQAEQFAINNPDKAKKIIQNRLHSEDAYLERIWPKTRLALSLDQGLIIAMEDESRWMIDSNLASNPKMPYYPDYIYWQSLKKVKPSSVTVIH
jgi:ABC-type nitrate/sulfonate/bicarbonate transport system substrate-binding protein